MSSRIFCWARKSPSSKFRNASKFFPIFHCRHLAKFRRRRWWKWCPVRIIDLHCYPNTQEWIRCQQPYVDALAKYWNRAWTAKTEDEVVREFTDAGVEAVLVALDLETTIGTPPCSNDFVSAMRKRHPDRIIQSWAAVDPFKGEAAIGEARRAIQKLGMLGFHFHPIMGHFSVDNRQ